MIMGIAWFQFWHQMDGVGRSVAFLLFFMSIVSWAIIFIRIADYMLLKKNREAALDAFWGQRDYHAGVRALSGFSGVGPYVILAEVGKRVTEMTRVKNDGTLASDVSIDAHVTRIIRYGLARSTIRLERGLAFLASVGSSAPFIGLFGTVWGILHALRGIAFSGMTQIDKIAGPISEALIMTAFGLAVAIPAVLAYNAFIRLNRILLVDLDGFAHDLHRYFCTRLSITECSCD